MPHANACYCCECGAGPWISDLYVQCIHCNHAFCGGCTPTYIRVQKIGTFQGMQMTYQKSNRKQPGATSNKRLRSKHLSTHVSTHMGSPPPLLNHTTDTNHVHLLNAVLPIAVPVQFPEIISSHPTPSEGEVVWTCCQCGENGCLVSTTPGCLKCGHERCSYCDLEEV